MEASVTYLNEVQRIKFAMSGGMPTYEECIASSRERCIRNQKSVVVELNPDCYYVLNGYDGLHFYHRGTNGLACGGYCNFAQPGPDGQKWEIMQICPLTITPSVWCKGPGCGGYHGFIQNDQWIHA